MGNTYKSMLLKQNQDKIILNIPMSGERPTSNTTTKGLSKKQ